MPDEPKSEDKKKKPEGWNIRPFEKELRIACQIQAAREDMYDNEWVQKELRKALGLPAKSAVVDSACEGKQAEVRDTVPQAARATPTKKRKS